MKKTQKVTLTARIGQGLDGIRDICVLLASLCMVILIAIFAWLVFGRYVLNQTPTWVEQLALVLVCYITFLGAAAGVRDNTHLGVTFIRESMPLPIKKVLRIIGELAMAAFGLVMLISCIKLFQFGWATKLPMLDVPESIRTLPSAICGGLIFVFAASRAIGMIRTFGAASASSSSVAD